MPWWCWPSGISGRMTTTDDRSRGGRDRILPDGARKQAPLGATHAIFDEDFAGQVLSFDHDVADVYAEIAAARRSAGKPISQFDAMIAAIVRSRGASLATRNVKDFAGCGIDVIDPWRA